MKYIVFYKTKNNKITKYDEIETTKTIEELIEIYSKLNGIKIFKESDNIKNKTCKGNFLICTHDGHVYSSQRVFPEVKYTFPVEKGIKIENKEKSIMHNFINKTDKLKSENKEKIILAKEKIINYILNVLKSFFIKTIGTSEKIILKIENKEK